MKRLIYLLLIFCLGCVPEFVPPGPIDPVKPPVVVPVTTGARLAIVIQETANQSTDLAIAIYGMRDGSAAKYLASNGHLFYVLDIDQKDEHQKPLAVIEKLKPIIGTKSLPVFIVAEKIEPNKLGKVLHCESLDPKATADNLIELTKRAGG